MSQLVHAAAELLKALHHYVDENLSEKLANIVKTHAGLAVAAVFVPIPGADLAAAAANTWTMYLRINNELGLKFSENAIKTIASGVATNIGGNVAVLLIGGAALKFIPGLGTLGGAAVMGATIYGVTIVAGIVYMRALAALANQKGKDFSEADLKAATDRAMADKEEIKGMFQDARKEYKPEH